MMERGLVWGLSEDDSTFPDPQSAHPDGLLAVGGRLSSRRLLAAYRHGIFPWYRAGEPILWWSPDPRCVIWPARFHLSRKLCAWRRQGRFQYRWNSAFRRVVACCAEPRPGDEAGSGWLHGDMIEAYCRLHQQGYAHSVECWHDDALVGGVYGVWLGRLFFAESMFFRHANASTLALAELLSHPAIALLDAQFPTAHLLRLHADTMPRKQFLQHLDALITGR